MTTMAINRPFLILLLGTSMLALAGCVSNAARERADAAYQASTARIAVLAPKPRAARVSAPSIGTRLKWSCAGPYTRNYDVAVAGIDSGLVRYTGNIVYAGSDGTAYPYEIEKHWTLTGTGLWSSQAGDKRQWFDYEYFRDFAKLKPGSVFRGPVPARSGNSLWVSDFEIAVGKSQRINHGVLGRITVIPITEKRKIFHKDYAATLVTLLEPKRGISVSWTYTDKEGTEECDLVHYGDKRGTAG